MRVGSDSYVHPQGYWILRLKLETKSLPQSRRRPIVAFGLFATSFIRTCSVNNTSHFSTR